MFVQLITSSTPMHGMAYMARVCTTPMGSEIKDFTSREQLENFIHSLYSKGHLSVFEHEVLTYHIKGISRACSLQLARHRHISRTEMSQRYVRFTDESIPCVLPDYVNDETAQPYITAYKTSLYNYRRLLDMGAKPEDARLVLPEAMKTRMYLTLNLRTLIELWEKRGNNPHAQWEIRELVNKMVLEFLDKHGSEFKFLFPEVATDDFPVDSSN